MVIDQTVTGGGDFNVTDRAARLLGRVYGSQDQVLQQLADTYELLIQLRHAGTEIDPRLIDHTKILGTALKTPTVAQSIPISVENPALAYDPTNDEFYVRSKSSSRPVYINTAAGAPALESGNLATLAAIAFLLRSTTPVTYNVTMTLADTEYSQALPANTKKLMIAVRDRTAFRLAFQANKVAAPTEPYLTLAAGETYYEDFIQPSSLTVYLASDSDGKVAEIVAWS
jgi:hypothetical protein